MKPKYTLIYSKIESGLDIVWQVEPCRSIKEAKERKKILTNNILVDPTSFELHHKDLPVDLEF